MWTIYVKINTKQIPYSRLWFLIRNHPYESVYLNIQIFNKQFIFWLFILNCLFNYLKVIFHFVATKSLKTLFFSLKAYFTKFRTFCGECQFVMTVSFSVGITVYLIIYLSNYLTIYVNVHVYPNGRVSISF